MALLSLCRVFLQQHSLLPPLLFLTLSLSHFLYAGDHAAAATALHMTWIYTPVVEFIMQGYGTQFPKKTQFARGQEVEDDPKGSGVSVKEVFLTCLVVVITEACDLLRGGAETKPSQSTLGKLLQGAPGEGVAVAPDIDENLQSVVNHIRSLGVTEQLCTLEVNTFDGLSFWDLSEEAVKAAVITADGVGAEVVVGIADDGHAGCRVCDKAEEVSVRPADRM